MIAYIRSYFNHTHGINYELPQNVLIALISF